MMNYHSESFLGSGYKRFDLKYIFDHIRNIGLVAAVFAVGLKLINHSSGEILARGVVEAKYVGLFLVIGASLLLPINFIQFIYVASYSASKWAAIMAAGISLPMYVFNFYLFYVFVFVK